MSGGRPHEDPDREPLLRERDVEAGRSEKIPIGWRELRYKLQARRLPILLVLGTLLFVLGFVAHPAARASTGEFLKAQSDRVMKPLNDLNQLRPGDLAKANEIRVLKGLLQTVYPKTDGSPTRDKNWAALDRLITCVEWANCTNEENVVIGASQHFRGGDLGGTGGEDVWARSVLNGIRELNYTFLFTSGHMDTLLVYQKIPSLVKAVIWERNEFQHCVERNETNYLDLEALEADAAGTWQVGRKACMQSHKFPEGIPHWKSFLFHFWANPLTPLGGNWTLSPEDYSKINWDGQGNNYIGYSIEDRCLAYEVYDVREHRGLVLAKEKHYFDDSKFRGLLAAARDSVPAVHGLEDAGGEEIPFKLVSTAGREGDAPEALPEGVLSLGRMPQAEYTKTLARSKLLLGLGDPVLSPSPYWALCMGVPFINPVDQWREDDPDNRQHWRTQQDALRFTPEPYVYHVRRGDGAGLARAMQRAAATPIGRFIPPHMRKDAVLARIKALVETDWYEAARAVVEGRYEDAPEWQYLAPRERRVHA